MERSKRVNNSLIFLKLFLAFFLLFYSFFIIKYLYYFYTKNNIKNFVSIENDKKSTIYKASMIMVGDALIHDSVYNGAVQYDGSYDFKPMLSYIKPIALKYDLKYYNQETILGGADLGYSSYPRFNSPQAAGEAFLDAGFNMVSLATNHTMDKGEQGVINSVNYWNSQKNVASAGQWLSFEDREAEHIYEINGIKYAFFSYTTWTNGLNTPYGKEYLNNVYSDEKAKNDIDKIRDKVDVIIVAMHWGIEYSFGISESQHDIANYLSSLGVNIIIGSHPHVVEPVEYINDNKTFVIYSLGNFISGQIGIDRLSGLMLELTIKKEVETNGDVIVTVDNPKAEIVFTNKSENFMIYPYSMLNNGILPNYSEYYQKYKDIVSQRYPIQWGLTWE